MLSLVGLMLSLVGLRLSLVRFTLSLGDLVLAFLQPPLTLAGLWSAATGRCSISSRRCRLCTVHTSSMHLLAVSSMWRGADQVITNAIDTLVLSEKRRDEEGGAAGSLSHGGSG